MIYSHGLINSCFLQHLAEKSKSSYYRFLICSSKNCFLTENITWHQKAIIIHQFAIHAKELQTLQDSKQWLWVCVRTCHACVMLMSYMEFRKSHCNEEEKKNQITFWNIGYSALYRVQANSCTSWLVVGSCFKNWLHGNAKISRPEISQKHMVNCNTNG